MKKFVAALATILLLLGTATACAPADDQAMKRGGGCCEA